MSETKPLDPAPWRGYDWSRKSRWSRFACIFDPRPEYEQDRAVYERENVQPEEGRSQ